MRRSLLSFLLPAFTAIGCANLVGLSDLEKVDGCVKDCGAAGAAGNTAGAAGVAGVGGGKAGQAGTGGSKAGTGGTGGTGGKSGAAGQSGAGGASGKGGQGGASGAGTGGAGTGGKAGTSGAGGGGGAGSGGAGGAGGKAGAGGGGAAGAGGAPCVPKTCDEVGAYCGSATDGCGTSLSCGDCKAPLGCGDPGKPNVCGCAPGKFSCVANELQVCAADGQGYVKIAACPNGTCNATSGKCNLNQVGAKSCQGQQLYVVDSGGLLQTSGAPCPSDEICYPDAPSGCAKCVPNGLTCDGLTLKKCSADGQSSTLLEQCGSAELCQVGIFAKKCAKPVCQLGETRCNGKVVEECNPGRTGFQVKDTCATAALCVGGICKPPACPANDKKCVGNSLGTCNADQTAYDTVPCTLPQGACENNACVNRGPTPIPLGTPLKAWVDSTEVTNAQYNAFLASKPVAASQPSYCSFNSDFGMPGPDDQKPVVNVDFCDARAYCEWAGKRLCGGFNGQSSTFGGAADPSLDQWTFACQGPLGFKYPYGASFNMTNCQGPSVASSAVVKSKDSCQGGFGGLYDMSGNVAEWEDACTAQAGKDDICIVRGGSWNSSTGADLACDTTNSTKTRDTKSDSIGFRCCADP